MNHDLKAMWGNHTLFHRAKYIEKILRTINMTQSIEKSILQDPLTTNNAIYRDSLKKPLLTAAKPTRSSYYIACPKPNSFREKSYSSVFRTGSLPKKKE